MKKTIIFCRVVAIILLVAMALTMVHFIGMIGLNAYCFDGYDKNKHIYDTKKVNGVRYAFYYEVTYDSTRNQFCFNIGTVNMETQRRVKTFYTGSLGD